MNVNTGYLNPLGTDLPALFAGLSEGKWYLMESQRLLLLGDRGRKWFLENEQALVSPHESDFYNRNLQQRFPVIMNFYPEEFHLSMKRRYSAILGKGALSKLEDHFRKAASNLFKTHRPKGPVDLFQIVAQAVVGGQLQLFFSLKADKSSLASLVDYEDLFTLGLYADAATQELWYAQSRFLHAEEVFLRMYRSAEEKVCELGLFADRNPSAASDFGAMSHFYNLSVAGSTNVAKLTCEVVESASKMGNRLEALIQGGGIQSAASHLIKEALRLLPWTENQITPPYLNRMSSAQIQLADSVCFPKGSQVYLLHCLEHMSEKLFPEPSSFMPERWLTTSHESIALFTFGVGRRKCCGEALVTIWLRALVEEYLKQCRFEFEDEISYKPYNPAICDVGEFSFRGVLAGKPDLLKDSR